MLRYLFNLQLAIILVGLPCSLASRTSFNDCSNVIGVTLEQKCIGKISYELHQRFRDTYVSDETPYAIYAPDHEMMLVFVTLYSSPLMSCDNLTMLDFNLFKCNEEYNIKFALSRIFCYNYPFNYVGELKDHCMNSTQARIINVQQSVLHYADISRCATLGTVRWWPLLVAVFTLCKFG